MQRSAPGTALQLQPGVPPAGATIDTVVSRGCGQLMVSVGRTSGGHQSR